MRRRAGAGIVFAAVAVVVTFQAARATTDGPAVHGPGAVTIAVHISHSHFDPTTIDVRRGTTVRFAVTNDDPIGHEFIVGGPDVHARHERGTEASHPPVPGELSLAPLSVATTSFVFDRPGTVVFACHLPGHLAYGMRGEVRVR